MQAGFADINFEPAVAAAGVKYRRRPMTVTLERKTCDRLIVASGRVLEFSATAGPTTIAASAVVALSSKEAYRTEC